MSAARDFVMPDVGEGIAEAEVVQWLVAAGDAVTEDQAVVVVETDKSQVELPSPFAGTVADLHADVGDIVKVGAILISVHTGVDAPAANTSPTAHGQPQRRLASPSTRRLAVTLGVDLAAVTATGPHGRVQADDVRAAAEAPQETPATHRKALQDTVITLRGLRRQIAKSMTQSLQIPHVTEFREIDASALLTARTILKARIEGDGIRLSVLPFLVKATARALTRHPSFNATYDAEREEITQYGAVNIGIATATDDGLIVPTVREVDRLTLREVAVEIDRVAELARTRSASPDQLGGAGFTVTNFGSFGTWLGTPIIRHPEVAIAGFGRIRDQVIPVDGQPAVRPVLPIVVAADHRINDGAHLAALVGDIAEALQQPLLLLD